MSDDSIRMSFRLWTATVLTGLPRGGKQLVVMLVDAVLVVITLYASYALRYATLLPPASQGAWIFGLAPLVTLAIFVRLGIYREVARFSGPEVIANILRGGTLALLVLVVVAYMTTVERTVPRSVLLIHWSLSILLIAGSRLLARSWLNPLPRRDSRTELVIIYGAGAAGRQLLASLTQTREFRPVLFVDDDLNLQGRTVTGLPVYSPDKLAALANLHDVRRVLLALPSVSRSQQREIIRRYESLPLQFMAMPSVVELASGQRQVNELREVGIEDILGREPIPPDVTLMRSCLANKVVMVTGAGGSIGSELCRQILNHAPRTLVLFDMSESALYTVQQEITGLIQQASQPVRLVGILGTVRDQTSLEALMRREGVQTVYHTAAHKHVPIVEQNPIEGMRNNIIGTLCAAQASIATGVENFVLVSTDKAVRPVGVMGASKRVAELVVQALAHRQTRTLLCMVRFGNVLGSSGSVVPLFHEQIRRGGPVTVTNPDMMRYFMTIAEAVQLVIQAGAMARAGEVFVLDMGTPVRIQSLAEKMIHLSGLSVKDASAQTGDIEIKVIGTRPGEKLREELLLSGGDTPTAHPRIRCAREEFLFWDQLQVKLDALEQVAQAGDVMAACRQLAELVPSYTPSETQTDKLIPFPKHAASKTDRS